MQHLIKYLVFWIIAWFRTRAARIVWAEAAQQLGGSFDPGALLLTAVIDGVNITAKLDRSVSTNTLIMRTIFSAAFPGPSMFQLQVYKEGFFSSLGKSLGGQDIQIGDDAFDKTYIIKSNSEETAKQMLSPELRGLILQMPAYSHRVEKGQLISTNNSLEKTSDTLVSAARLFASMAKAGQQIVARWQQVLASLSSKPIDPASLSLEEGKTIELESKGVHVSIGLSGVRTGWVMKSTEFCTTISARLQNHQPVFYLSQHKNTAPKEAEALPEASAGRDLSMNYKLRTKENVEELLALLAPVLTRAQPDFFFVDGKNITAIYGSLVLFPETIVPLIEAMLTISLQSNQLYR
jgi:hypothetical protein